MMKEVTNYPNRINIIASEGYSCLTMKRLLDFNSVKRMVDTEKTPLG
jgi:hypothetical protein